MVQRLGFGTFTAEGLGSILSQGPEILQAVRCGKKKKKKKKKGKKILHTIKKIFFCLVTDLAYEI